MRILTEKLILDFYITSVYEMKYLVVRKSIIRYSGKMKINFR